MKLTSATTPQAIGKALTHFGASLVRKSVGDWREDMLSGHRGQLRAEFLGKAGPWAGGVGVACALAAAGWESVAPGSASQLAQSAYVAADITAGLIALTLGFAAAHVADGGMFSSGFAQRLINAENGGSRRAPAH